MKKIIETEGNDDFEKDFQEIKREYLIDLANNIHLLETLIEEKRWEDIYRLGHQLRGSGESYGLKEVSSIGAEIEEAASKCDQVKLRRYLSRLCEIKNLGSED